MDPRGRLLSTKEAKESHELFATSVVVSGLLEVCSLFSRQAKYLVQSQPKLAIQVTKAIHVVDPAAVEINGAIQSLLEHCPPHTGHGTHQTSTKFKLADYILLS